MIPLDNKTKQDFLSVKQMQHLESLGVDASDAKYIIVKNKLSGKEYVTYQGKHDWKVFVANYEQYEFVCNTYTLAELLYKLDEWPCKDGYKSLMFFKDAPFYCFFYENDDKEKMGDSEHPMEYPLTAAYALLCWCIKNEIPYSIDISDKGEAELDTDIEDEQP